VHPPWKIELRALAKLSLPVITVQVGMMLMGFVDTMMVGHFDEAHLAAAGLGIFYSVALMMFGLGVLLALDPVMSQAVGAGDEGSITRNMQRGVILAVALTIPTGIAYTFAEPVLLACGQDPELAGLATDYIWTLIPSILPFYLFQIMRTTMQAYHRTAPVVWTILVANLVNVFLNWALIFGNLGADAMGVQGSAIATLGSRWLMLVVVLFAGRKQIWVHLAPWSRRAFEIAALRRLVRVGAPIGAQIVLEFGAFGMTLMWMGWIHVPGLAEYSALAGHQVAINLASMTYMFPLGLSSATGVRVGNGIGRGDISGARWSALIALVLAAILMGIFALIFVLFPEPLTALFTENPDVGASQICILLLPIAAVFQVMDGVQVVSLGALRGVADTKAPMIINLVGFWVIGIPAGYWFAFGLGGGPEGLWWGLTVGLTVVAVALVARVWFKLRGELTRTEIDREDVLDPT